MKRSTNVIVSNLSRDNILFSTLYTGLFLLFRKKNWGATGPPGPSPCYGTAVWLQIGPSGVYCILDGIGFVDVVTNISLQCISVKRH